VILGALCLRGFAILLGMDGVEHPRHFGDLAVPAF
jgi:hypothetical protein